MHTNLSSDELSLHGSFDKFNRRALCIFRLKEARARASATAPRLANVLVTRYIYKSIVFMMEGSKD